MRKIVLIIFILTLFLLSGCTRVSKDDFKKDKSRYEEIKNEIIRFHVLANSDTPKDQELKLKVRDAVIDYVYKDLENSNSIEESREYLINNKRSIENIAKEIIKESGYNYRVSTSLAKENFPDKMYGDMFFPQGEYEAFKILIGEAEGQNWWCVMFPPLCFIDETKESIDNHKTKENFKLEEGNKKEEKEEKEEKIIFKSKILERLKKIFS